MAKDTEPFHVIAGQIRQELARVMEQLVPIDKERADLLSAQERLEGALRALGAPIDLNARSPATSGDRLREVIRDHFAKFPSNHRIGELTDVARAAGLHVQELEMQNALTSVGCRRGERGWWTKPPEPKSDTKA